MMERSIWEKMALESVTLNEEYTKFLNIGYFIIKKDSKDYVVGLYRIFPLVEAQENLTNFENLYIVYDIKEDLVYDEFENEEKEIFNYLPSIDSVQFDNGYLEDEEIEKLKKVVKDSIEEYISTSKLSDNYFDSLLKIYGIVDKSSKDFYEFFIKECKAFIK